MSGRHGAGARRSPVLMWGAVAAAAVVVVAGGYFAVTAVGAGGSGCETVERISVAVDPTLAPVVSDALAATDVAERGCAECEVRKGGHVTVARSGSAARLRRRLTLAYQALTQRSQRSSSLASINRGIWYYRNFTQLLGVALGVGPRKLGVHENVSDGLALLKEKGIA